MFLRSTTQQWVKATGVATLCLLFASSAGAADSGLWNFESPSNAPVVVESPGLRPPKAARAQARPGGCECAENAAEFAGNTRILAAFNQKKFNPFDPRGHWIGGKSNIEVSPSGAQIEVKDGWVTLAKMAGHERVTKIPFRACVTNGDNHPFLSFHTTIVELDRLEVTLGDLLNQDSYAYAPSRSVSAVPATQTRQPLPSAGVRH